MHAGRVVEERYSSRTRKCWHDAGRAVLDDVEEGWALGRRRCTSSHQVGPRASCWAIHASYVWGGCAAVLRTPPNMAPLPTSAFEHRASFAQSRMLTPTHSWTQAQQLRGRIPRRVSHRSQIGLRFSYPTQLRGSEIGRLLTGWAISIGNAMHGVVRLVGRNVSGRCSLLVAALILN